MRNAPQKLGVRNVRFELQMLAAEEIRSSRARVPQHTAAAGSSSRRSQETHYSPQPRDLKV